MHRRVESKVSTGKAQSPGPESLERQISWESAHEFTFEDPLKRFLTPEERKPIKK